MYLGSLSASLVSLGFVAQISATGDTFRVFFVLGVFTFVRLVESAVEDIFYGRAINRIRSYYLQLAGPEARYFMLLPYDDVPAVLRNMGLMPSRWQLYFTSASAIAVVNSVVGGAALAIACWVAFDASLGTAAVVGGVFAIVSVTAHVSWSRRRLERGVPADVLFPSPAV